MPKANRLIADIKPTGAPWGQATILENTSDLNFQYGLRMAADRAGDVTILARRASTAANPALDAYTWIPAKRAWTRSTVLGSLSENNAYRIFAAGKGSAVVFYEQGGGYMKPTTFYIKTRATANAHWSAPKLLTRSGIHVNADDELSSVNADPAAASTSRGITILWQNFGTNKGLESVLIPLS